jgi:hypothetical protein
MKAGSALSKKGPGRNSPSIQRRKNKGVFLVLNAFFMRNAAAPRQINQLCIFSVKKILAKTGRNFSGNFFNPGRKKFLTKKKSGPATGSHPFQSFQRKNFAAIKK